MKLGDLTLDSLAIVQGVEKSLRQRRRNAWAGLTVAGAGIALHILLAALDDAKYLAGLKALGTFVQKLWKLDLPGMAALLATPEVLGAALVIAGLLAYLLLRTTAVLLRESGECFRYSFEVDTFSRVEGTPGERCLVEGDDQLALLSRDLSQRLSSRIRRLSLLSVETGGNVPEGASLAAHIHIGGWHVVRQTRDGNWIVQVTANIRIGGKDRPSTQAQPVEFGLRPGEASKHCLSATGYDQLIERLYSRVATEVYRQIEEDIRNKIKLFPGSYRRAVALSNEAEDFVRSNTIDAYDRALELYREALRHFGVADVRPVTSWLAKWPMLWRTQAPFIRRKAAVVTGYARCVVYRRKLSALTGHRRNSMFEVPGLLTGVIEELTPLYHHAASTGLPAFPDYARAVLTFPKDFWLRTIFLRPGERMFEHYRRALFDAFVARALARNELGAFVGAGYDLGRAKAIDPLLSERDPLYLLAAGELEPDLEKAIGYVERSAELAPDFQIAKFRLAYYKEMRFRNQDDLSGERAERIIEAYDEVLELNPGNVAALAAQGYLLWLRQDLDAEDKLQQGLELKNVVEETYVGELNYRLARIAAETKCYAACYDYYAQSVTSDPGVAVYKSVAGSRALKLEHEYIGSAMMRRFESYRDAVVGDIDEKLRSCTGEIVDAAKRKCSAATLKAVRGFVLNDFGNACYHYSFRHGFNRYLRKAIAAYGDAADADPSSAVARYNLAFARIDRGDLPEDVTSILSDAELLAPAWPAIRTGAVQVQLRGLQQLRKREIEAAKELAGRPGAASRAPESVDEFSGGGASVRQQQPVNPRSAEETARTELESLREKLKNASKSLLLRLRAAIAETRFAPMVSLASIDAAGGGLDTALLGRIARERLAENDLEVIRLWAEVLWNGEEESAWRAARALSTLHQTYYEEDFEGALLILNAVEYRNIEDPWLQERARDGAHLLRVLVVRWLDQDPIHCGALQWLYDPRLGLLPKEVERIFVGRRRETTGCRAQLGFIHASRERWDLATTELKNVMANEPEEDAFVSLLSHVFYLRGLYREAADHLERAIRLDESNAFYHERLGAAREQLEEWEEASAAYRRGYDLLDDGSRKEEMGSRLKSAYTGWGNRLYEHGEYVLAAERYASALELDDTSPVIHSNRALALEQLEPRWTPEAILSLQRAVQRDDSRQEYRERLQRLQELERLRPLVGDRTATRLPLVTPLVLEVSEDLIPLVSSGNALSKEMTAAIDRVRGSIHADYGLEMPGVRVRGSTPPLSARTYVISVMEVPLATGGVAPKEVFVREPADSLMRAGVSATEAGDPRTGRPGAWAAASDRAELEELGCEVLTPIDYMAERLRSLVEANLAELAGVTEVRALVERSYGEKLHELEAIPDGIASLTAVVKGLLAEQAPVALKPLVDRFLELKKDPALTLPAIVEDARRLPEISPRLQGNANSTALFTLDSQFEGAVRGAVQTGDPVPILAMTAEDVGKCLAAVRNVVDAGTPGAIIVRDPFIRAHVRKLVELKFPRLHVLADDELLPDRRAFPHSIIGLQRQETHA